MLPLAGSCTRVTWPLTTTALTPGGRPSDSLQQGGDAGERKREGMREERARRVRCMRGDLRRESLTDEDLERMHMCASGGMEKRTMH